MDAPQFFRPGSLGSILILVVLAGVGFACNDDVEFGGSDIGQEEVVVLADEQFAAGLAGEGSLRYVPRFGQVDQAITLRQGPPQILTLTQDRRDISFDKFTQGHSGLEMVETFAISEAGRLDLLVVIDDSGSMELEQEKLSDKLDDLTMELVNVDWQIGVVTTSDSCLRGGGAILKNDPDADAKFKAAIQAGTDGSGRERGVYQAIEALNGRCADGDKPWLRADAAIGVLFVSDEDSDCQRNRCRAGERPADLLQLLQEEISTPEESKVYALTWDDSDDQCERDSGEEEDGDAYLELVEETGGLRGSICAPDYASVLQTISADVARIISRQVELSYEPINSTLQVVLDGDVLDDSVLDGKVLQLPELAGDSKTLEVSYKHAPQPMFSRVQLTGDAAKDAIVVGVNGQVLPQMDWEYDTATNEIVFDDLPPEQAKVEVHYRVGEALGNRFELPADIQGVDLVRVSRRSVTGWQYEPSTGMLTIPFAPLDGAEVQVRYRQPEDAILEYEAPFQEGEAQFVDVVDADTGEVVEAEFLPVGAVRIADVEIWEGRQVVARFDLGDREQALAMELPHDPIPDTIDVRSSLWGDTCITDLAINGRQVSFDCATDEVGEVEVAYRHVIEIKDRFSLPPEVDATGAEWLVWVNDEPVNDFSIEGTDLLIDGLQVDDVVRVRVQQTLYNYGG